MALGKRRQKRIKAVPAKLQITSMMDMFTIILIFLLCSFSENPETIDLSKNVQLPESTAKQNYKENIRLVLSNEAMTLGGKTIGILKDGKVVDLDPHDLRRSELYKQLTIYRKDMEKHKEPMAGFGGPTEDGKDQPSNEQPDILFLCDKRLSFKTINSVVKTAGMAGFPNFQFAVLAKNL